MNSAIDEAEASTRLCRRVVATSSSIRRVAWDLLCFAIMGGAAPDSQKETRAVDLAFRRPSYQCVSNSVTVRSCLFRWSLSLFSCRVLLIPCPILSSCASLFLCTCTVEPPFACVVYRGRKHGDPLSICTNSGRAFMHTRVRAFVFLVAMCGW